jgi:hypothetical protein
MLTLRLRLVCWRGREGLTRARRQTGGEEERRHTLHGIRGLIGLRHPLVENRPVLSGTRCYAQPRKKLPERSVEIFCSACDYKLYKYKKNGKGKLVKCYLERIVEDFTDSSEPLQCPQCDRPFARKAMIHGRPAHKMIGGKVYMK